MVNIKPTVCALLLGREGSLGFPGKNTYPVLGRPLMVYPMMAAENSKFITHRFFSTDSETYKKIGRDRGWEIIDRPPELATSTALGEDAISHAFQEMNRRLSNYKIEYIAQLFCNSPTVLGSMIDHGVAMLENDPQSDSAVSVSVYNMWSPLRARKMDSEGYLIPFIPFETFGDPKTLSCDRDSQGDVIFADMSLNLVRSRAIEDMQNGLLPQKWMGRKILPIRNRGGLDVDYDWQIPQAEFWLRKNGFDETKTPYSSQR